MRAGGGGVPDNELLVGIAVEEDAAVAAVKHPAIESWRRGDMRDGDGSGDEADATALGGGASAQRFCKKLRTGVVRWNARKRWRKAGLRMSAASAYRRSRQRGGS
jgi:hypothetical protein